MSVTVTDLFCGAGGSSVGATAAGMTLAVAANHWRTAVDVHQTHFPDARHMLEPQEVAAAMAFPDGYIPSDLSKKDRVTLAGNAVTPPVMTAIAERIMAALGEAA